MSNIVPIEGWPGYFVSDEGRVYSSRKGGMRELRSARTSPTSYPRVSLCRDGVVTGFNVHTLVAHAFLGDQTDADVIRHLDGNPHNNSVRNLAYGTYAENEADKARHGRRRRGADVSGAKLTEAQVLEIRAMFKNGATLREIAEQYGLHATTAHRVIHGDIWSHLPVPNYSHRKDPRVGSSWNRGERHGMARLHAADIVLIAALLKSGESQEAIASQFEVSRACIGHIAAGRTWRHVTGFAAPYARANNASVPSPGARR